MIQIRFLDWVEEWVKVLIFVGFDDIGCDIGGFGVDGGKVCEMLDFTGFLMALS